MTARRKAAALREQALRAGRIMAAIVYDEQPGGPLSQTDLAVIIGAAWELGAEGKMPNGGEVAAITNPAGWCAEHGEPIRSQVPCFECQVREANHARRDAGE